MPWLPEAEGLRSEPWELSGPRIPTEQVSGLSELGMLAELYRTSPGLWSWGNRDRCRLSRAAVRVEQAGPERPLSARRVPGRGHRRGRFGIAVRVPSPSRAYRLDHSRTS